MTDSTKMNPVCVKIFDINLKTVTSNFIVICTI